MLATTTFSVAAVRAQDLKSDEEVVFFPTFASFSPDLAHVDLPIHVWIFERPRLYSVGPIGEILGLDELERKTQTFRERAAPFLFDNERNKAPGIVVRGKEFQSAASTADGHSETVIRYPTDGENFAEREFIDVRTRAAADVFGARVQLIGPEGISVVSDIDDTIKFSNVLDKSELIRNTFVRPFKSIEGMSEHYRTWEKQGAVFHYVSGSPWQLYDPLAKFLRVENFPRGSLHLRKFRLKDRSAIQFFDDPQEYKLSTIEPILKAFPKRRFLLVGDSGEHDPEVYGELARRHPTQIKLIAIRNITDAKPDDGRMTVAFRGVDMSRVLLFRDAKELGAVDVGR